MTFFNCSDLTSSSDPTDVNENSRSLTYSVAIDGMHEDSIRFSLVSQNYSDFILPYIYFDNPVHKIDSSIIKDIEIVDGRGAEVSYSASIVTIGTLQNTVIHIPDNISQPVTISYRVNHKAVSSGNRINNDAVELTDSTFSCLGNAVFIIPFISSDLTTLWRSKVTSNVSVSSKQSIPVYGIPSSGKYTCNNLYELIFSQIYAGKKPLIEGYAGGVRFTFVNFSDSVITPDSCSAIGPRFSAILDEIRKTYGTINDDMITVSLSTVGGGLEGTFSFTQLLPSAGSFYYVLSHEALHQFVGIRCGEYDDPWWKEGATTYLSYLIAVRLGLNDFESFRKYMTVQFTYADSSDFNMALSDNWWRANMFESGKFDIIYVKGAQVMMILDYATRAASANRYSIEDVSAYLVKNFDGSAFHRSDLLQAFSRFGNPDVNSIFNEYIDKAGEHPSDSLLNFTFNRLDSLEAFR